MAGLEHGAAEIADTYADTLVDLAQEAGVADEVLADFGRFVELMKRDDAFADFMMNPGVDLDNRGKVLEKHFRRRINDLLLNTLLVINRKGRSRLVELIYERFGAKLEEARNEIDVQVTSAVPLTNKLRERIRQVASEMSGKSAKLIEKVEPAILGGLVLRIGDEKIDNSVARHVEGARESLLERAAHEVRSGRRFFEAVET
jgi:F-type H+-transporting ATPase subunit delta